MDAITKQFRTTLHHVYGKKKHVHNSSNNPPKVFSLLLKKKDLGENYLQNPKSQRMEMMERKREREWEIK